MLWDKPLAETAATNNIESTMVSKTEQTSECLRANSSSRFYCSCHTTSAFHKHRKKYAQVILEQGHAGALNTIKCTLFSDEGALSSSEELSMIYIWPGVHRGALL